MKYQGCLCENIRNEIWSDDPPKGNRLKKWANQIELYAIEFAFHKAAGNKAEAAKILGVTRTTLVMKIKKLKPEILRKKK